MFFVKIVNSEIYNQINVIGNERLSVETILMFSGLKLGEDINESDLNLSIKIKVEKAVKNKSDNTYEL